MKKIFSLVLAALLVSLLAINICAADDAKTRLYNAAKEACPENYHDLYLGTVQSVLDQIDVTDEQADQVIALIDEGKNYFTEDKGASLESYTAEEKTKAVELLNNACDVLLLEPKMEALSDVAHDGDAEVQIYYKGSLIATLDGDPVKVTGGIESSVSVFAALALIAVGLSSLVVIKKRVL